MSNILAIDQGTHASRALIISPSGTILASEHKEISLVQKVPHIVEQDASEILESVHHVTNCILSKNSKPVTTATLATQRSTLVAWDKQTGKPLAPAISWQDRRCTNELADIKAYERQIHQITGLPLSPHYLAGKIRWLLRHNDAVIEAKSNGTLLTGSLSSFLCFHLLNQQPFIIDHSNAARSLLFNIDTLDWDDELLTLFKIPKSILPECVPTLSEFGQLKEYGIPLKCVCGDQNAALYAYGSPRNDRIMINIGTGAFILQYQGAKAYHHERLLASISSSDPSHVSYLLEGTVNGAGSALNVLQKQYAQPDFMAAIPQWLNEINEPSICLNDNGGLGSPWWIDRLQYNSVPDKNNIPEQTVALIESIVFMLQHNIQLMNTMHTNSIHISGGLSQLDGICQKIADLSRLVVFRFTDNEATTKGAAWLVNTNKKSWVTHTHPQKFTPASNPALEQRYQKYTSSLLCLLKNKTPWLEKHALQLLPNTLKPFIVAHRGYQKHYPENTLQSVVAAIEAGTDCIEVDVQFSKDNVPMIFHDKSLLRTTGIDASIFDYTLAELNALSASEENRLGNHFTKTSIPTLHDMIKVIFQHKQIHFFIEIKQETLDHFGATPVLKKIISMIEPYSDNCTIISFNRDCLDFIKQHSHVSIGWVLYKYNQSYLDIAQHLQPDYLICNYKKLSHPRPANGPWQWMLYEINSLKMAEDLFNAGVNYISTSDVGTLARLHSRKDCHDAI